MTSINEIIGIFKRFNLKHRMVDNYLLEEGDEYVYSSTY